MAPRAVFLIVNRLLNGFAHDAPAINQATVGAMSSVAPIASNMRFAT